MMKQRKAAQMAEIQEHVAYLSQNIGPRPAGTEEERQAALYMADMFQSEADLTAEVEDFTFSSGTGLARLICCALTIVMAVLALFLPVMVVPSLVVTLVAAVIFALEALGIPTLSRILGKGVSQNVVAKYLPATSENRPGRRRKIILVAHCDSGSVRRELNGGLVGVLPVLRWAELGALVAIPLILLIRLASTASGAFLMVLNVLTVIAVILALLPIVAELLRRTAPLTEGANCNASGAAVLLELANRISLSRTPEIADDEIEIHGEDAARGAGLVPEGADLVYDAAPEAPADEGTAEERLLAAKAAIAALSGKPVSATVNIDVSDNLVQTEQPPIESDPSFESMRERRAEAIEAFAPHEAAPAAAEDVSAAAYAEGGVQGSEEGAADGAVAAAVAAPAPAQAAVVVAAGSAPASDPVAAEPPTPRDSVPAWFKSAQEKAHKNAPAEPAAPVQRSRYADALDAAVRESSIHFQQANAAVTSEAEMRLQQMRNSIMEVKAPSFDDAEAAQMSATAAAADPQARADRDDSAPAARGVDGYLARTMEGSGYAAAPEAAASQPVDASAAANLAAAVPAVNAESPADPSQTVPFVMDAAESAASAEAAASATGAAAGVAGVAATQPASAPASDAAADRTIAFIPVAIDDEELLKGAGMSPAAADVASATAAESAEVHHRKKRDIALPSLSSSFAPIGEHKQRAPLAGDAPRFDERAQKLRAMVPSIGEEPAAAAPADAHARQAALRQSLPSLSGVIRAQHGEDEPADEATDKDAASMSQAGTFASIGATGAFAPVGDELLDDVDPDDMYIEDADDSAYDEQFTETGAFAGPGYVDMPKSRASRFFGKFHFGRKKKEEETTPQEWIGVDDEFEARAVGKARGGWESFREDQSGAPAQPAADSYQDEAYDDYDGYDDAYDDGYDDYDGYDDAPAPNDRGRWNGGGFSRGALGEALGRLKGGRGGDAHGTADDEIEDRRAHRAHRTRRNADVETHADASYVDDSGYAEGEDLRAHGDEADQFAAVARAAASLGGSSYVDDVEKIKDFRYRGIDTEVWFVALGAELADNGGMKAFIAEHAADLKGAIIIDLEGLGAGELTLIEQEGTYRSVKASSRMKRLTRKASSLLGMPISSGTMLWKDSAATCAMRHGCQAMHLAGMERGKTALFGEADDVIESIDEATLAANADFVMEVVRAI